ncbi:hypothetical protein, partial [Actinomadura sp. RB99]|uniref:hypothetical protein n=1 Tax=Actinomadura sp. RB99 TaxID=2691577 RepID=UPI0016893F63
LAAAGSDAERVRLALDDLGADATPAAVRDWLTARGASVSDPYLSTCIKRERRRTADREGGDTFAASQ